MGEIDERTDAALCPTCLTPDDKVRQAALDSAMADAWDEGFETARRWNAAPMCRNPYRAR